MIRVAIKSFARIDNKFNLRLIRWKGEYETQEATSVLNETFKTYNKTYGFEM